jgi:hypothetical protein
MLAGPMLRNTKRFSIGSLDQLTGVGVGLGVGAGLTDRCGVGEGVGSCAWLTTMPSANAHANVVNKT